MHVKSVYFIILIFNVFPQFQSKVGSICYLYDLARRGVCIEISKCNIRRKYLSLCNYTDGYPIVCCPTSAIKSDASSITTEKPKLRKSIDNLITNNNNNKTEFKEYKDEEESNKKMYEEFDEYENYDQEQIGRISKKKCMQYSQQIKIEDRQTNDTFAECVSRKKRIVGGKFVPEKGYPHMAALGYMVNNEIVWNCGGTLISEEYVVTAAHCLRQVIGPLTYVRLGSLTLTSPISVETDYEVKSVIKHPRYKATHKYNDIGLIRLVKRVNFTQKIQPACLDIFTEVAEEMAEAAGWGQTGFADEKSNRLMIVTLPVVTNRVCNHYYRTDHTKTLTKGIIKSQLCAGNLIQGGKDTCTGDSGGPLTVLRSDNQCHLHIIIGITSFGKFCGLPHAPGVYTRIASFIHWIEKIIWPNE